MCPGALPAPEAILVIASKRLVPAIAVQDHAHMAAGHVSHVQSWHSRFIRKGFVVLPDEAREEPRDVRGDDHLMMIGSESLGDLPSIGQLIVGLCSEPEGKSLHR